MPDKNQLQSFLRPFAGVADEEGLKRFHSALMNEPKDTNSDKADTATQKTERELQAAAIAEETAQVAITGTVLPGYYDLSSGEYKPVPRISVKEPPKEYAWTMGESGYEDACNSAVNAVHHQWASTRAAAAGYNSQNSLLDVLLFLIRAGRIKSGDPRIQEGINLADKYGFSGNIRERIVQELHNAEKRVPKEYCDFNTQNT